ncbi:MAG: hypothetical protein JSU91_00980 [Thermoplasmatales archaeon]|nr:MAG: hypothetical protein JSU91_00980 [Thermoplasmatales archaeon]
MKKLFTVQISLLLVVSVTFVGMLYYTDIYEKTQGGIVEVLCLSCIKLYPKTSTDFTFETGTGEPHPDFIWDSLREGPVFLHYSEDACAACDVMFPSVTEFLQVNPIKDKSYYKLTSVNDRPVHYYYIYLDDEATSEEWLHTFDIYDKDHIHGLPMFSVITINYAHSGLIEPYFTTLYGQFKDNDEQRIEFFNNLMDEAFVLYDENLPGFLD